MATLSEKLAQVAADDGEILALARALGIEEARLAIRLLIERAAQVADAVGDFAQLSAGEQDEALAQMAGLLARTRAAFQHLGALRSLEAAAKVRAQIGSEKAKP